MPHDVFISYSTKDKPAADATCAVLESKGIRCWIAPRDITPGTDWGETIVGAIYTSKALVLVFSANANLSHQVKREVERAVTLGLPVIPLRIENVLPAKSLEYFLDTALARRLHAATRAPPQSSSRCHRPHSAWSPAAPAYSHAAFTERH